MWGVVGLLAAWASYHLGKRSAAGKPKNSSDQNKEKKHPQQAFVLAVGLKFQSVEDRVEFEKIWRPLAEYVARDEPTTLAFEFLVADNDPTKVLVYERYTSKDVFTSIHRTSEPFLTFKQAQGQLPFTVEVTGQSYLETNFGFMDRE